MTYKLAHHQKIFNILNNFNVSFLADHGIYFGGGTRIALELHEFRESIDIDLLCPTIESYRAVRNTVTSASLGSLVKAEFDYLREISFDRYAVRVFIKDVPKPIKLEIVSFEKYHLTGKQDSLFPIPYLDVESCFYTKLLANADRATQPPYKDIIDILFMTHYWGDIPHSSLANAQTIYGDSVIKGLNLAVNDIKNNKNKYLKTCKALGISDADIDIILNKSLNKLITYLEKQK
ncbi:nucleotidyl transferase AbiEii/AbiGii toxin family protein [Orbaceae bacterium ac157xtp]